MIRKVALVAALATPGCAGWDAEAQARDSAREWLDCPDVALEAAGETAWHAAGCGRTVDVACSTSTNEPHCIRVRIASAGSEVASDDASATSSATPVASAEPGASTTSSAEPVASAEPGVTASTAGTPDAAAEIDAVASSLRATLDARREDVLACASRERVVVRASWAADGAVTLALEGELAGAPEEGCVRAALSDVRVDASAPGTVLHLIRR